MVSKAFRLAVHVELTDAGASARRAQRVSKAFRLAVHVEHEVTVSNTDSSDLVSQKPFGLRFMLNLLENDVELPKTWKKVSKAFRLAVHVERTAVPPCTFRQ